MATGNCLYCNKVTSNIITQNGNFCSYGHMMLNNPKNKLMAGLGALVIGFLANMFVPNFYLNDLPLSIFFYLVGGIVLVIGVVGIILGGQDHQAQVQREVEQNNLVEGQQPEPQVKQHDVIEPGTLSRRFAQVFIFGWVLIDIALSIALQQVVFAASLMGLLFFTFMGKFLTHKLIINPDHFVVKKTLGSKTYYYGQIGLFKNAQVKYTALGKPTQVKYAEFINQNQQVTKVKFSSALPAREVIEFLENYNNRFQL